jgi:hypothetical protein
VTRRGARLASRAVAVVERADAAFFADTAADALPVLKTFRGSAQELRRTASARSQERGTVGARELPFHCCAS